MEDTVPITSAKDAATAIALLCLVEPGVALTVAVPVLLALGYVMDSVDGQLSTNDTVILQASGASGVVLGPWRTGIGFRSTSTRRRASCCCACRAWA